MGRAALIMIPQDSAGNVKTGSAASITITEEDGSALVGSIYAARSGGSPLSQPLYPDNAGMLLVFADRARGVKVSVNGGTPVLRQFDPDPTELQRNARPIYTNGLLYTPEYFYEQATGLHASTIDPGVTDETAYIQAAIEAALLSGAGGGGTAQLEPRIYNYSTLRISSDLAPQAPDGATGSVTIRGQRGQSTGPLTEQWGTYLQSNVAAGNSTTAKTRSLIDITGSTYVSIEEVQIGRNDNYGSGSFGGNADNVNPAAGIMASGAYNPDAIPDPTGWESTALYMKNVLMVGHFTSATLVLGAYPFSRFDNCQFYNYKLLGAGDSWATTAPTGAQAGGHALILAGANAINPNLPGTGTDATRYVMYSQYADVTPRDQYSGSSNNVFTNCQFWTSGSSTSAPIRLIDALNNLFDGGAAGVTGGGAVPVIEIVDIGAPLGNSPLPSQLNTFMHMALGPGNYALYAGSEHTHLGFVLASNDYYSISNAIVGALDSASQVWEDLRIEIPRHAGSTPTNGLINLNNTQNAVRLKNCRLDARGLALTNVGGIDALTEYWDVSGTPTLVSGGAGSQSNRALKHTTSGLDSPIIATGLLDSNGNAILDLTPVASAVNKVRIRNNAAGNSPTIDVQGSDTDVSLTLATKGAGVIIASSEVRLVGGARLSTNNVALTGSETSGSGGATRDLIKIDGSNVIVIGSTDSAGMTHNVGTVHVFNVGGNGKLRIEANGTMLGQGTIDLASGQNVVYIPNRTAAPSGSPVGGGVLYAEAGSLKWKGSGGTVTTIANA